MVEEHKAQEDTEWLGRGQYCRGQVEWGLSDSSCIPEPLAHSENLAPSLLLSGVSQDVCELFPP